MDALAQFKAAQRQAWASFIPFELTTCAAAPRLVAFAGIRAGQRVLVLERTVEFHDRVRGEVLVPWGVAEAKRLGFDGLLRPVGNDLRWWDIVLDGMSVAHRDIPATCLPGIAVLTYYHPAIQDILLHAAEDS